VFPLNFYTEKVEVKTATRMFKAAGQVTNGAEISTVLTGIDNFDLEKQRIDKDKIVITFNSQSEAIIGNAGWKYSIVKNDNQFLFYSESGSVVAENPYFPSSALYRAMLRYIDKIDNSSPWLPPLTRDVRVAYGDQKELRLAALAYHIYRAAERGGSYSYSSGLTFNEFDAEVVTKLKNDDYIVVKEYQIVLRSR
jgi:hypothetical protein